MRFISESSDSMIPAVYYCADYDFDCADYLMLLPPERRERALRYKTELTRKNCIGAYVLLMNVLNDMGFDSFELEYSANGKPYIKGNPVYFSLSHSDSGYVCAVDKNEIGVDVQTVAPPRQSLENRVCSPKELAALERFGDRALGFTRLWTFKESIIKKNAGTLSQYAEYEFDEIKNDFYRFGCHFLSFDSDIGSITVCGEFETIKIIKKARL